MRKPIGFLAGVRGSGGKCEAVELEFAVCGFASRTPVDGHSFPLTGRRTPVKAIYILNLICLVCRGIDGSRSARLKLASLLA